MPQRRILQDARRSAAGQVLVPDDQVDVAKGLERAGLGVCVDAGAAVRNYFVINEAGMAEALMEAA